jgi:hypothetical protein
VSLFVKCDNQGSAITVNRRRHFPLTNVEAGYRCFRLGSTSTYTAIEPCTVLLVHRSAGPVCHLGSMRHAIAPRANSHLAEDNLECTAIAGGPPHRYLTPRATHQLFVGKRTVLSRVVAVEELVQIICYVFVVEGDGCRLPATWDHLVVRRAFDLVEV